jgi:polar amino acid transport system substrate-binding protein
MSQMTTRRFLKTAAALVTGLVLAACGKQEPPPPAPVASAPASAPAPAVKV